MAELSTLGAVIKTAYEGQANTNPFTDAEQTKLAGVDPIASLKSNLSAAVDPTVNEDSGDGYAVGSRWVNTTLDKEFVCLDATVGAAVWTETTGAAGGAVEGTAVLSTGEVGGTKFLREDGDGTSSWQTVPAGTGDLRADGTVPLTANWDVGAFKVTANQLESDVATGTAPLVVASTTVVPNLNVSLLEGNAAAAFAPVVHGHEGTAILSTGEVGGTKFLREDGDGTSSWQAVPASGSVATDAIWDAAGDIVQGTGANTAARLAIGTALQQLRVNAGATALEYFTPSAGAGDFKADGSVDMTGQFRTDVGTFDSDVADGASAVAYSYDTQNTYSTAGAKLASWNNNTAEKIYFDKDGSIYIPSGQKIQETTGSNNLVLGSVSTTFNIGSADNWNITNGTYQVRVTGGTTGVAGNGILFAGLNQASALSFQGGSATGDAAPANAGIKGGNAKSDASTNLDGANAIIQGGDGASGSAGDADGGHVYLDGGQGFGTGTHGDVVIGNTRGDLLFANDYTVATLPTGIVGKVARVTDATTPAMGATVAGGGAAAALVWYNGTNWTVIGI